MQEHIRDRVKELRRVPASQLLEHPNNWRLHPPEQRSALHGVLAEIGFADAVIARETPDGLQLIDGHLRRDMMGDQEIPVLIVDVTEEEANKMLLTLDPLASMAGKDDAAIATLLETVTFNDATIMDMLKGLDMSIPTPLPTAEDPGPQIDKAAELQKKWGVERGQVWEIGRHRLMCGDDCSQMENSLPVDLVLTDPPYGTEDLAGGYGRRQLWDTGDGKGRTIVNDNDLAGIFQAWPHLCEMVGDGWLMVFCGARTLRDFFQGLNPVIEYFGEVIWDKGAPGLGYHIRYAHESIAVFRMGAPNRPSDALLSVLRESVKSQFHPHEKPVGVVASLMLWGSNAGGSVVDPFLGTGTTMVAAEQLGRICYGMEIEPKYVAVTLERMSGMGLEPKLVKPKPKPGNKNKSQ